MGKNKKTTVSSTYEPISKNIYFDGKSYRVRMSINGERVSRNFKSKKAAYQFRKEMAA